jgi:hypothetical protein
VYEERYTETKIKESEEKKECGGLSLVLDTLKAMMMLDIIREGVVGLIGIGSGEQRDIGTWDEKY